MQISGLNTALQNCCILLEERLWYVTKQFCTKLSMSHLICNIILWLKELGVIIIIIYSEKH